MNALNRLPLRSVTTLGLIATLAGCAGLPTRSANTETLDSLPAIDPTSATFVAPVPLQRVRPNPPVVLYRSGVEGEVRLAGVIDTNGRMRDLRVVESSNFDFNAPSISAVSRWTFKPAEQDGVPVAVRVHIPVEYILKPE